MLIFPALGGAEVEGQSGLQSEVQDSLNYTVLKSKTLPKHKNKKQIYFVEPNKDLYLMTQIQPTMLCQFPNLSLAEIFLTCQTIFKVTKINNNSEQCLYG